MDDSKLNDGAEWPVQHVRQWLKKAGYAFELQVGRVFQEAGWGVLHALRYHDPKEGLLREIDLVAQVFTPKEWRGPADDETGVRLMVECKRPSEPWVGFAAAGDRDRLGGPYNVGEVGRALMLPMNEMPQSEYDAIPEEVLWQSYDDYLDDNLFRADPPNGATVRTLAAAAAKNDTPYEAVQGALAAAEAYSTKLLEDVRNGALGSTTTLLLHIPIVVTGAPLILCEVAPMGEPSLTRVEWLEVEQVGPISNFAASTVPVVAFDHLPQFSKEVMAGAEAMMQSRRGIGTRISDSLRRVEPQPRSSRGSRVLRLPKR